MISYALADAVLFLSFFISLGAYVFLSRREGSYLNVQTLGFITSIPALFLLPFFFSHVFGTNASSYAYIYVYTTIAVENVAFAYTYTRRSRTVVRFPCRYAYHSLDVLAIASLALAVLMYVPILLQFREYLLDPRQIYVHTRTGFGINFYISSTFAFLAVILVLFSKRSWRVKGFVVLGAAVVLSLHGSKGQMLSFFFLLALFEVYVKGRKLKLMPSLFAGVGVSLFALLLFAATMTLADSPAEILEQLSQYSDYARNAMLVIDSHVPVQYGRLTLETTIIGRIPRVLWPNKPQNFGEFYLADRFYPGSMNAEAGAPDFGLGLQYADFGVLAICYLAGFSAFRGWLARVFVNRTRRSRHPADFFMVIFLAGVSIFPIGGIGWLLPEAIIVAICLRFASCLGAETLFYERVRVKSAARGLHSGPDIAGNMVSPQ